METSPSVISASDDAAEGNTVLVKYMTDYDEYSPFTVVLDHLQFSTLDDYASSARARLESSRLHSPPLLFLFRVMETAPLYENSSLGDPMGARKWLVLKEFDVNDEERDLPKLQATLFGNYARLARDVTHGDIMVTERPLIQARTRRRDDDDDDDSDVNSEFELILGAGKKSQHFCSRVYIFRTRVAGTQTKDIPEQETTPKKKPRKTKRPKKRILIEPDSQDSVAGQEADVVASAGRGGTDTEVVAALREALRDAEAVLNTAGEVASHDVAAQGASTATTKDTSGPSNNPSRRSPSKTTRSADANTKGTAGEATADSGPPEVELQATAAFRESESTNSRSTAEQMNQNLDDDFAKVARVANRRGERRVYTALSGCKINLRVLYNVWAVITKVRREPSPTEKKAERIMAMLYIQDPTFKGSFGFPDYQFSIMGTRREDFPPLSVGAVIRIHDMETQSFLGESTGRVWNPAKLTVIEGGVGDPIKPLNADQWDDNFRFTADDVAKVEELRRWWASLPRAAGPPPPPPATPAPQSSSQAEVPEVPEAEAAAQPGSSTTPASPQPSSSSVTIPEAVPSSPTVAVPESSEESEVDPNEVTMSEEDPVSVRSNRVSAAVRRRSKRSVTIPEEDLTPARRSKRSRKQKERL